MVTLTLSPPLRKRSTWPFFVVLPCLAGLHGGFVLVLAEVHELGDRGLGHRGHLDQVEVCLRSQTQRVLDAHDADLLALGSDQTHLGDPDALIDAGLADGGHSFFYDRYRISEEAPRRTAREKPRFRNQPWTKATMHPRTGARGIATDLVDPATLRSTRVEAELLLHTGHVSTRPVSKPGYQPDPHRLQSLDFGVTPENPERRTF